MDSSSIIEKYKNSVIKEYWDLTLILYGSTVYGVNTSDLDICYLSDNKLSKQRFDRLKDLTRIFHLENGLRIDEEVPYDNKLVYSNDMVKKTFEEPPFPYANNKFNINPILKNKIYLSSLEMSKRLLLNILTVRNIVLFGNEGKVKEFSNKAWDTIIRVVLSYAEIREVTIDELINLLYEDPYSHATGELYLGYKDNLKEKMDFLESSVGNSVYRLEKEQIAKKTLKKKYKFNEEWIKNGSKN
mgnify:FL=1